MILQSTLYDTPINSSLRVKLLFPESLVHIIKNRISTLIKGLSKANVAGIHLYVCQFSLGETKSRAKASPYIELPALQGDVLACDLVHLS